MYDLMILNCPDQQVLSYCLPIVYAESRFQKILFFESGIHSVLHLLQ